MLPLLPTKVLSSFFSELNYFVSVLQLHVALQMKAYFETYQLFFKENLLQLFAHFSALQVTPDIYIIDWSALITVLAFILVLVSFMIEFRDKY